MSNYDWQYFELNNNNSYSSQKAKELGEKLGVDEVLAALLVNRGIETFEQAKSFFRPSIEELHDPFLMMNMKESVQLLEQHLQRQSQILVYGDYDVDGTCGVTLLYDWLNQIGANVAYYIPNRYTEGYGVSEQGIDFTIDNDFSLLITVDCGIKATEKLKRAVEAGVDVIVCDHHLPGNEIPPALILNPKQINCPYPWKELCGTGIAFKFVQAYCQHQEYKDIDPFYYLDFVALATAADMVPLKDENRVLLFHGIEKINANPHPGVKSLIKAAHCKTPLSMRDLTFGIAPRINAAGRIGEAARVIELFTSGNDNLALELSEEISADNEYRRSLDQQASAEALELLQNEPSDRKSNLVFDPSWNKGIIGIVASRILEHHYKPTIVLTQNPDGKLTGSGRSVHNFNIHDAIDQCCDHLETFGGHAAAAGLTLHPDQLESFKASFEQACAVLPANQKPIINLERRISLSEITPKFLRILNQFGPFGVGNEEPLFYCDAFEVTSEIRVLGGEHLKFQITNLDSSTQLEAIAFRSKEWQKPLLQGLVSAIAFTPEINEWQGQKTIQLNIKDFQLRE